MIKLVLHLSKLNRISDMVNELRDNTVLYVYKMDHSVQVCVYLHVCNVCKCACI